MFRRELRIQLIQLSRLGGNVLQARVLAPMPRGAAGGGHADGGDDRQDRSTTKILTGRAGGCRARFSLLSQP